MSERPDTVGNVVSLFGGRVPRDPRQAAVCKELDRIKLILEWSSAMRFAGHMPDDVAKAFHDHFGHRKPDPHDDPGVA